MAPWRAALCLTSLLLLAAAAGHAIARAPSWRERAFDWAQGLEEQLAAWQYRGAVSAEAAAAETVAGRSLPLRFPASILGGAQQEREVLHVTLQLPNQQTLEVGEDSTPEELIQKLLSQVEGGELPSGIEVVSVERITSKRSSPWRAALDAITAQLRSLLPTGPSWRLGSLSIIELTEQPATSAAAADDAVPLTSSTGSGQIAVELPLVLAEAEVEPQEEAAAAVADEADVVLAKHTGGAVRLGLGRRLQQLVDEEARPEEPEQWEEEEEQQPKQVQQAEATWSELNMHVPKLFGPGPAATAEQRQQQAEESEAAWAEAAAVAQAAAEEEEGPLVVVRVLVLQPQQQEEAPRQQLLLGEQQAQGAAAALLLDQLSAVQQQQHWQQRSQQAGAASLLDQLALAQQAAGAALLGRKAAAGDGAYYASETLLHPQHLQQQPQAGAGGSTAAPSPLTIMAVDAVFCAASAVALACMVLLSVDAWRGRQLQRQREAAAAATAAQRADQRQQLLAPLLVVAADEVGEGAGCSACNPVLQLKQ